MRSTKWTYHKELSFASNYFIFFFSFLFFFFENFTSFQEPPIASWFDVPNTQMLMLVQIFILFESNGVLFEGAFSFWVLSNFVVCQNANLFIQEKLNNLLPRTFWHIFWDENFARKKTGNFKESIFKKCFLKTDYIYSSLNTKTVWLNFLFTSLFFF